MNIQVTNGMFHVYRSKALHNYFTPCHREYSGQSNRCDKCAVHDGNWLDVIPLNTQWFPCVQTGYILRHGIEINIL